MAAGINGTLLHNMALAVVFETVPWLLGAAGNVAYFFLGILSTTSLL